MSEQQKYFSTQDGTSLFYRYRPAADGSSALGTRVVMVIVPVNAAIVRVSALRFQT